MGAAHRAVRIFPQLELTEFHAQGVDNQKSSDERLTDAEYELDRLHGLNSADDSRQNTEHPTLRAARHESRRGRLRIEAAIARPLFRAEDRRLSFEPEDASVRVRLA